MKKSWISFLIVGVVLIACSKANEETAQNNNGGNNNNCDTTNMSYATDILPILQNNCYSCHGNGQANGGVALDSYTGVKKQADNGNLIGVITHAAGYPPMPQGGQKLSDCNINKIKAWIARGTQDN